jgi:glycosyltransferase involved in cell wall biosynthesis
MRQGLRHRLKQWRPAFAVAQLREAIRERLSQVDEQWKRQRVVSLQPAGASRGNVLLSYILEPFLLKPGQSVPNTHTNLWESQQIAQTFLDLRYCVDVIDFENRSFVPEKEYSIFIDVRWNLQRLASCLGKGCLKIHHVDVCHILYQNNAESRRLLELQQRKGVTLQPRRFEPPNLAIEHADCATVLGNRFTLDTFRYAKKPLFPVPLSNPLLYPWPENKDFEACRKRYLWFGSGGLVRKGLDLVLDAFAGMPDYELVVCGPVSKEADFEKAYYRELYQTPNIRSIGWVDVASPEFLEIARQSLGMIYPSCAEGQCGGVITSLHAGLIPVISYESGVDVHDFGVILPNCSIREIQDSVRRVSNLPASQLEEMARDAWEYARSHHTKEIFSQAFRNVIERIIEAHQAGTLALDAEGKSPEGGRMRQPRSEQPDTREQTLAL